MVKDGLPFVIIPALIGAAFLFFGWWIPRGALWFACGVHGVFLPRSEQKDPGGEDIIVSAADGRVTRIDSNEHGKVVSVFLSPLDVHVNRSPIAGKIETINYTPGKKSPATSDQASLVNERNSLTIVGKNMTVVCTQIAGILARRIVCWNKEGD
jgi:phosphatidylserine decarboxylase